RVLHALQLLHGRGVAVDAAVLAGADHDPGGLVLAERNLGTVPEREESAGGRNGSQNERAENRQRERSEFLHLSPPRFSGPAECQACPRSLIRGGRRVNSESTHPVWINSGTGPGTTSVGVPT